MQAEGTDQPPLQLSDNTPTPSKKLRCSLRRAAYGLRTIGLETYITFREKRVETTGGLFAGGKGRGRSSTTRG